MVHSVPGLHTGTSQGAWTLWINSGDDRVFRDCTDYSTPKFFAPDKGLAASKATGTLSELTAIVTIQFGSDRQ